MMKAYVNCFTGSIAHILNHPSVSESDLMLLGDGYLLRSGVDEYGVPELTFEVLGCGELALEKLGVGYNRHELGSNIDFNNLKQLCELHNNGVIAWANSSYLSYSSMYSTNMGYLHSIVLKEVSDSSLSVFDPLVVDIPPYSMYGHLSYAEANRALADIEKIDSYNVMGSLLKIAPNDNINIDALRNGECLSHAAKNFFSEPLNNQAIIDYLSSNQKAYESADDERKKNLSRRIFDHIQVLYVIPLLELIKMESASLELRKHVDEEIREWRSVAMMALKNSKILSERVFNKIISKLEVCSQMRCEYWEKVVKLRA